MEELLNKWQMPQEVIEAFTRILDNTAASQATKAHIEKNGITTDHFKDIINNNEYLKELCPIIGIRINLKKKICEFLESQADTETVSNFTGSFSTPTTYDVIIPTSTSNCQDISLPLSDIFTPEVNVKNFDLKTLLETSPCGKSVLEYYRIHNTLDSNRKNRLTDIIIKHLFTIIVNNNRLTLDDYNIITGKIISLFPSETAGTYFTKPIKKSESGRGKSVPARGKLVDKVRNVLFQLTSRTRKCTDPGEDTAKKQRLNEILHDIHKEDIQWLEKNEQPWDDVLIKWNNTQEIRHNCREYITVQDFISQWKILRNPKATELINDDFEYLHPGKGQAFNVNWNSFFKKFIQLKEHAILADESKQNLLISLKDVDTENKIPTQITLLANLVPPKGRTSKKGKCSTQECIESIMRIVENPGDINTIIENQKERAIKQKNQVQPYLILLGTLLNIRQVYLVIDDLKYTFDSVETGFDILFKCYHVLNAKYPRSSEHIHLIIQRCVYKITTIYDNPVPYIADILNLL